CSRETRGLLQVERAHLLEHRAGGLPPARLAANLADYLAARSFHAARLAHRPTACPPATAHLADGFADCLAAARLARGLPHCLLPADLANCAPRLPARLLPSCHLLLPPNGGSRLVLPPSARKSRPEAHLRGIVSEDARNGDVNGAT